MGTILNRRRYAGGKSEYIQPDNVIIYYANEKLANAWYDSDSGIHYRNFSSNITSHTFENGIGVITFADNLTIIPNMAFRNAKFTKVSLPNSITTLNTRCFSGCTLLEELTIPPQVNKIYGYFIEGTSSLKTIISEPLTAPAFGDQWVFRGAQSNGILYVHSGSTGYDSWLSPSGWTLGRYNWTMIEF